MNPIAPLPPENLQDHQHILDEIAKKFPIEKVLSNIHRKKEEQATQALAKKLSLPYLNLMHYQPEPGIVEIISKELATDGQVFAFKKEGQNIYLAISDVTSPKTLKALETLQAQHQRKFVPVLVSPASMTYLLSIYDLFAPSTRSQDNLTISQPDQAESVKILKDWTKYQAEHPDLVISQLFDIMMAGATYYQASDIHIEPTKTTTHLRFRIDGVLQDIADLPAEQSHSIINRIKLLSDLKLNIKESAQDGRFSIAAGETSYDIRVSILPTGYGESAVLRLLPQKGKFLTLDQLGLVGPNAKIVEHIIKQPNGLILNTGPTGSGKTTTLYAILDKINTPDKKIITIEDPIEYKLSGITQSQVNPEENYTFATGLRSILRQDPDIILVGEIRDSETANIAINAALTGHLVLSTLHTNDAAGAIPRLADLGLKPDYFIESILAIIAQRLVRKICPHCTEDYTPSAQELNEITEEIKNLPSAITAPALPKTLKRVNPDKAKTCSVCGGLGYKGMLGIFEILQVNDAITKAVLSGVTIGDIKKLAIENGMVTLKQDGILKMLEGVTTWEEIQRVTGEDQS
ncbi:MAG: GspE/PulE family protein [Patescibacteria group bacterium]